MSEFSEMIKEAFGLEEPFDPRPDREDVLQAIESFDRRMRLVRIMVWTWVSGLTALSIWMGVLLLAAPADPPTNRQLFYLGLLVLGVQGLWVCKNWFSNMLNHTLVMRELKRTQLWMLDLRDDE